MRFLSSAAAGMAGLGMLIALAPSGATGANPRSLVAPGIQRPNGGFNRQHARRADATPSPNPSPCSTNYPTLSFTGIPATNVAGGQYSAVAGGQANMVCDAQSGVGAGYDNIVSNSGLATASFDGGGSANTIVSLASFIGAGESGTVSGRDSAIVAGNDNAASGSASIVGSGYLNAASGTDSAIAGGYVNVAMGTGAFIGGGFLGTVTGNGSGIAAGGSNCDCEGTVNLVSGYDSFIGAGDLNAVAGNESFLGSGQSNSVGGSYSGVLAGAKNSVFGQYASVLGGYNNTATGEYSIVAGGQANSATKYSFAAGYEADAAHSGSFVWSDYTSGSAVLKNTAVNQFVVRASGGTYFYSNEGMTSGVVLTPGSGAFASLSDRNAKTDIVPLDDASILSKVASLPVSAWRYKSENGVRHVGPMAQDFYAAFGVGVDDRHITSIDEDGVALAAIKALYRDNGRLHDDNRRKDAELVAQRGAITTLRDRVQHIEAQIAALSKH